jgi:hypothetical protein
MTHASFGILFILRRWLPGSGSGEPRKSPLRVATGSPRLVFSGSSGPAVPARAELTSEQLRTMMIGEFSAWLRSRTNKEKRPFQEETITAYATAARALSSWMTSAGVDGDFTACDTGILNRFFRDYHASHGQGGTNTKQPSTGGNSRGWAITTATMGKHQIRASTSTADSL